MILQSLTEHQSHLLGGFIALAVLFCGLLGLLLYLDRRGVKTGARQQQQPKTPNRKERRGDEKVAGSGKKRRPRIKKR